MSCLSKRHLLAIALMTCTVVQVMRATDSLTVGDAAPAFSLPWATKDSVGTERISLHTIIGQGPAVLAFYPADWSGGCTKEMCTLRDNFSALGTLGLAVFGVSGDYVFSHKEWASALHLPFVLLSDHDHQAARSYESYNDASGYNKRTVFVIDRGGRIAYIDRSYKVGTADSFERLLKAVTSLR
jgi:glutaredoxin-dependent peroxiredoxin